MAKWPTGLAYAARVAVLAAVYAVIARLGLMVDAVSGFATLTWPPSGIALAALLVGGSRFWPGVALGAFLANAWTGAPIPVACAIATGNTLEAVLGAFALRRIGFRGSLEHIRDVLGLVVLAALLSTVVSATVGVTALRLAGMVGGDGLALTWRAWWLGDVIGDLVVAPLLLTWRTRPRLGVDPARLAEIACLALSIAAVWLFVFVGVPRAEVAPFHQAYLFFPLLIWAALRLGQRGVTATTLLVASLAILGAALGRGPFLQGALHTSLMQLQVFLGVAAITGLVLGAAISERREAQAAIAKQHGLLQAIVEGTADAIFAKDTSGRYQLVNSAAAASLGRAAADVIGHNDAELLPMAEARILMDFDRGIIASGEICTQEEPLTIAGEPRTFLTTKGPYRDGRGAVVGVVGIARDITDRKRSEAEERRRCAEAARLYEDAQQAIGARDEFLSVASHELRTPLSALVLQLALLHRLLHGEAGTDERWLAAANKALKATHRLSVLVESLLDVSRLATGRLQLEIGECDLAEIARDTVERLANEASRAGCELRLRADRAATGRWDSLRLEQVLANLLSNALKYGAGKPVEVRVEASTENVRLTVRDHGIGIAKADIDRIFRRFERAAPRRHYGGLGLGLYITQQIVAEHGGTVRVISEPDAGSVFVIDLPRRVSDQPYRERTSDRGM